MRPLSRQAKSGYVRDLDRLKGIVDQCPVFVTFDVEHRQFCVGAVGDPAHVLHRGRYQVMHAWLIGYVRGYYDGLPMVSR